MLFAIQINKQFQIFKNHNIGMLRQFINTFIAAKASKLFAIGRYNKKLQKYKNKIKQKLHIAA